MRQDLKSFKTKGQPRRISLQSRATLKGPIRNLIESNRRVQILVYAVSDGPSRP